MNHNGDVSGLCLVFTLSMPWKNYHREQFIRNIASEIQPSGGIVICIEPTILSIFNIFNYPERILGWMKGNNRFRKDGSNIYITHAKTFEHILLSVRFKLLSVINRKLIKRQILKILYKIDRNIKDFILVLHRPELQFLIGFAGERGTVYDCCDDHLLTSDMKSIKVAGNIENEKFLSQKCNFVITTSNKLFNRNKNYNPNTFIIENGHSFTKIEINEEIESYVKRIKRPIVGYIGIIRGWIDFNLLEHILSNNSNISFLFVGDIYKDSVKIFQELNAKYDNLFLTGRVNYNVLPVIMKYFDVGIIPFKNNEFMESVNPNKFYEMISCNIPIVSTNIGDLKLNYSDILKVSDTIEEFNKSIKEYLTMDEKSLKDLKNRMMKISGQFNWQLKAEYFHELLNEYILNKK